MTNLVRLLELESEKHERTGYFPDRFYEAEDKEHELLKAYFENLESKVKELEGIKTEHIQLLSEIFGYELGSNEMAIDIIRQLKAKVKKLEADNKTNQEIVDRLKKQIEFQMEISPPDYTSSSLIYILKLILNKDEGWNERHDKMTEESDKMFRTNTQGKEIDIDKHEVKKQ